MPGWKPSPQTELTGKARAGHLMSPNLNIHIYEVLIITATSQDLLGGLMKEPVSAREPPLVTWGLVRISRVRLQQVPPPLADPWP